MPLNSYGVLSGAVVDTRREGTTETPHYQIELAADDDVHYRVAVNVESQETPSELRYRVVEDFRHPMTAALPAGSGWTPLPSGPGGANLDFIRGNLFDPATLRVLPPELTGPDNDLADLLDHYVLRARHDTDVRLFAFGQRWGPEAGVPDKVFGFVPGNGVHDVHMNQGNSEAFRRDDGVWQDGGLLLHFGAESRWVAIFLAFQSQSWHTDDTTGHAIGGAPGPREKIPVRIVGALVNPVGPAPEAERVTLLNASPAEVDLTGWRLADRAKHTCALPATRLAAGATLVVPTTDAVQLGNNGGAITLLDAQGLKVHGVSYTGEQSHDEGWTLVF
ncbi:DUF2278 domain-containing protein [Amycolatopsis balhimycina DSM 5908]|uniref:DUF2278 domain-containing protein n=1 Tax=Amycolatopsis balhimycina DSM 5908 TaxID=1081091 RepID=A0A428WV83_AMYBA|nr:DUF2278 family protein [Amycolatopsis balhimycina]RSM46962.1 DUF2278 domain-containing protein [Amycolatopsis balhimycina DSM 5908]